MKKKINLVNNWTMQEYGLVYMSLILAKQYFDPADLAFSKKLIFDIETSYPELFVTEEELDEMERMKKGGKNNT